MRVWVYKGAELFPGDSRFLDFVFGMRWTAMDKPWPMGHMSHGYTKRQAIRRCVRKIEENRKRVGPVGEVVEVTI